MEIEVMNIGHNSCLFVIIYVHNWATYGFDQLQH